MKTKISLIWMTFISILCISCASVKTSWKNDNNEVLKLTTEKKLKQEFIVNIRKEIFNSRLNTKLDRTFNRADYETLIKALVNRNIFEKADYIENTSVDMRNEDRFKMNILYKITSDSNTCGFMTCLIFYEPVTSIYELTLEIYSNKNNLLFSNKELLTATIKRHPFDFSLGFKPWSKTDEEATQIVINKNLNKFIKSDVYSKLSE